MSFSSFVLTLLFLLAAVCIIAGIILTWLNMQKQEHQHAQALIVYAGTPCYGCATYGQSVSTGFFYDGVMKREASLCQVCMDHFEAIPFVSLETYPFSTH